jgi:NADPH:quinone reductase-like Zn-dependent oxidoreductase
VLCFSAADALDKCLSVLKPTGHYAHIQNLGTQPAVMQRLRQQHDAGQGPGVSHIFVTPNGQQLGQVLQMMVAGKVTLEVAKVRPMTVKLKHAAAANFESG